MNILRSFLFAFNGLYHCFKSETNFKLHAVFGGVAVVMGFAFGISFPEWTMILLCIAIVMSFELFNSVIEKICDHIEPAYHPAIKIIKDMAAAGVLIAAIATAIIGAMIFLPKIL